MPFFLTEVQLDLISANVIIICEFYINSWIFLNVRILGRKGVLVLNAIATIPDLAFVQNDIPKVLDIVQFSDGHKYSDFDAAIDDVAAWTIGGLVAGKILAKVGFFAVILKFWKIIIVAIIALFKPIMNLFRKKDKDLPIEDQKQLKE